MRSSREFKHTDQLAFAELSGDWNPLHVDSVAARRLLPGRAVVHGIHLVLWAADQALGLRAVGSRLLEVTAEFRKPVGVGEPAQLEVVSAGDRDQCRIRCGTTLAAVVEFAWEASDSAVMPGGEPADALPPAGVPATVTPEELRTVQGASPLFCARQQLRGLFPRLERSGDRAAVADLLASTRVVGMLCPGLHSIFNRLSLRRIEPTVTPAGAMHYAVQRYDNRFSLARLSVRGQALEGQLDAFVRPKPKDQPSYNDLASLVVPGEFSGWRALVVGGSRGLGEVSAKLLAAGGAKVVLTYHSGAEDAARIAREIAVGGGTADAHPLDVVNPEADLKAIGEAHGGFTHLLYFATGPIFVAERGGFDPALFRRFCDVYVTAFASIVGYVADRGLNRVLYPSSSALDELPADMGEYAAAKAAGEATGAYLAKVHRGLMVRAPRLPRLATDQTRSLMTVTDKAPAPIILSEIRSLQLAADAPRP